MTAPTDLELRDDAYAVLRVWGEAMAAYRSADESMRARQCSEPVCGEIDVCAAHVAPLDRWNAALVRQSDARMSAIALADRIAAQAADDGPGRAGT